MGAEKARYDASQIERELETLRSYFSQHKYGDFWSHTKTVVDMFKAASLSSENHERLWAIYSDICQETKREMQARREEAKNNAEQIGREIENLRYNHLDPNAPNLYPITQNRYRYNDFWQHSRQISGMFKGANLQKEDRERLWSSYRSLCDEVSGQQKEEREESERNRGQIEGLITDAYFQAEGSNDRKGLEEAKSRQTQTLGMMKERRLLKQDRERVWNYWRRVNERISYRRERVWESNYLKAKEDVSGCVSTSHYGDPYEALNQIKDVQRDLPGVYMSRDQRHELNDTLGDAWKKAFSRIEEHREEKRRKYEEWRQRTERYARDLGERIRKSEGFIQKLEGQISDLEGKEAGARSDIYAEKVRGWIEEDEEKIEGVRRQIKKWEDTLYSVKEKLDK